MGEYRAILIFKAPSDKVAKGAASRAAESLKGKVDRLTKRAETWGAVKDTSEPEVEQEPAPEAPAEAAAS